jgi:phosphate transport system substrate-binding protein
LKKFFAAILMMLFVFSLLGGCSQGGGSNSGFGCAGSGGNQVFNAEKNIYVVSREDGSGTRGTFIDLFGMEYRSDDGTIRKDLTTKEAIIADKTDVVMTNVTNSPYVIGYISLGSLNDTVKALQVDGVSVSVESIQSGAYRIQRPINIAYKDELTDLAGDFINFILSREGQLVVTANDYVPVNINAPHYSGNRPSGKIVTAGSSSVTPVMEKLKEAYLVLNPDAIIEVQMSDSTAGMNAAINGTCDIGMASRELKEGEKAELTDLAIALDGIVLIVHNENPIQNLTSEQIKNIYTGKITKWSELYDE